MVDYAKSFLKKVKLIASKREEKIAFLEFFWHFTKIVFRVWEIFVTWEHKRQQLQHMAATNWHSFAARLWSKISDVQEKTSWKEILEKKTFEGAALEMTRKQASQRDNEAIVVYTLQSRVVFCRKFRRIWQDASYQVSWAEISRNWAT